MCSRAGAAPGRHLPVSPCLGTREQAQGLGPHPEHPCVWEQGRNPKCTKLPPRCTQDLGEEKSRPGGLTVAPALSTLAREKAASFGRIKIGSL